MLLWLCPLPKVTWLIGSTDRIETWIQTSFLRTTFHEGQDVRVLRTTDSWEWCLSASSAYWSGCCSTKQRLHKSVLKHSLHILHCHPPAALLGTENTAARSEGSVSVLMCFTVRRELNEITSIKHPGQYLAHRKYIKKNPTIVMIFIRHHSFWLNSNSKNCLLNVEWKNHFLIIQFFFGSCNNLFSLILFKGIY